MADNSEKILETLKKTGKAMRPGEIAEASGLDKEEVTKLLSKMKKAGTVSSPKACFYQAG
jgi:DNA-binding IclR family transcriptional regulator